MDSSLRPFVTPVPARPPFDGELVPVLDAYCASIPRLTADTIEEIRDLAVTDSPAGRSPI